jgi:predicted O-linked N-acetylglucosamine transferase (SPINDLY family)
METLEERLAAAREKARTLYHQGRLRESLAAHDEALRLAPDAMVIRLSAARLAHALELQEVSLRHFETAAGLDPRCYQAVEAARRICVGAGIASRARHYSRLAYDMNPAPAILMSMNLVVPSIMQSTDAIREARAHYRRGVLELLSSRICLEAPEGDLGTAAFFLAYHGENDRELQIATANLFLQAIPTLQFVAPHCVGARRRAGKIRIGFISRFFASHSIFSTSIGLIEKLSREIFEVIVLRITPSRDDEATARIRGAADHTVDLDPDLYRARNQIAALALDILFYQDIGMEPMTYFLSFARLAPVQCVSFGHPNTTGIPTMDYFISSDLFEPPEAEAHYSEKLVQLKDLPTLAYYFKPKLPAIRATPESFGLPADATLYVCPQTLYKLHPDFDEILQGILSRDGGGLVVLIAGQFQEFTDGLRERFAHSLPGLAHRVVFLPFMAFERFMQLLDLADVVLDSIHFNGMNTSLQAFAVGTPVVTLPGRLQRGRHTQAMYRKMGMSDCIAADPQHYIDIALRIGSDRAYAGAMRERILANNHVLFEDARVISEFERFFIESLAATEAIHVRVGRLMIQANQFDRALDAFTAALRTDPRNAAALQGRAQCLAALARAPEAVLAYTRLLEVMPAADYMQGERFHMQMNCCDWRDFDAARQDIAARVRRGDRADVPGAFMAHCDSPEDQLICARTFAADVYAVRVPPLPPHPRPAGQSIRVAYLSADFGAHATSFLAAGMFEAHDRSRFETHAISFGPPADSAMRRRLMRAFDQFDDVRPMTDRQIAALVRERGIDIAVDVKGHTLGARPGIFAFRPAPVQVSFLAYPGTLGTGFMDYIIADRIVIPESQRIHYAEQIIYMPGSYQVNDSARVAGAVPTRRDAGLPESAFVFCCFNSGYKITPDVFDDWMHILRMVPSSVLWLLEGSPAATANLRSEAMSRGVGADRLVFAPWMAADDHLARCALADLFLDTRPYNAHTTASDALWSGVPVITLAGRSFASRVATSLLHAVGLRRLSVSCREEYRSLAARLAGSRAELKALKDILARARERSALFDSRRYCRQLETAYEEIVTRNRRGEAASLLEVP